MPDLAEQIRTVIDADMPSITADEVMHRESRTTFRMHRRPLAVLGRGPAVAWAVLVAVAVGALVIGVGFATLPHGSPDGGAPPPPRTLTTRSFAVGVDRVTFTYPSAWETHQYPEDQTSFSSSVVFAASQALHDPCTTSHSTPPGPLQSKVCLTYAVGRLDPDGVYLEWSYGYDGGPPGRGTKVTIPGSPITVGGLPGTIDTQHPGTCASIGGDESIDVYVSPGNNGWLMQACLPRPGPREGRFSDPRHVEVDAFQRCERLVVGDARVERVMPSLSSPLHRARCLARTGSLPAATWRPPQTEEGSQLPLHEIPRRRLASGGTKEGLRWAPRAWHGPVQGRAAAATGAS